MGLLFTDGFDSYAASADLVKKWAAANSPWTWGAATGRYGGGGVSVIAGNNGAGLISLGNVLPGASTGIFAIGFYAKFTNAAPTGTISPWVDILDGANTRAGGLGLTTSRFVTLLSSSAAIMGTGTRSVCDGNWHYFEWRFNLANAVNTQTLYIDATVELNISANMTAATRNPTAIRFVQNNAGIAFLGLDDVFVYDSTGSPNAANDYPVGIATIYTTRPASDSAVQFTPDSGITNYNRVNEVNGDGDSSYVQASSTGFQDLYNYGALSAGGPITILGAMANSYIENAVTGTQNFNAICKSSGTQATGTAIMCPTSYKVRQQAFNTDPNTGGAWTTATLNAATFGARVA
jgi:hypothetical protein